MKILVKTLLILGILVPSGGAIVHASIQSSQNANSEDASISKTLTTYTMTAGDLSMTLNRKNLHFTITKGGQTFSSGETRDDDEEITSLRAGFLESAASLTALNSTAGESTFALFDGNHAAVTKVNVEELDGGLVAHVTTEDGRKNAPSLSLGFDIEYRLEKDGFSIALTNIEDKGSQNVLSAITLYPGFDMSYGHCEQTYLIPDGSGALIDVSSPSHARSALSMRTYGRDIGISPTSRSFTSSEQLAWPMFGRYGGGKSFLVTVEEGQEYSELNAKVAGMSDNYNTAYFRFILRDTTYQYFGLSESSKKPMPQANPNEFTPRLHYHLYDEDMDYAGLAKKYQTYLEEKGLLTKQDVAAKMRLEFLMGDSKKALFGKDYVPMASARFVQEKVLALADKRSEICVDFKGYTAGGYDESYPDTFPVDGRIGDLSTVAARLSEVGVDVGYRVDTLRSFSSSRGDLARNASQKLISTSDYVDGSGSTFYRLSNSGTRRVIDALPGSLNGLHAKGASFTSIGFDLYSTHYQDVATRSSAIKSYQDALAAFPLKRSIRKPNLYMLPYADEVLDAIPSSSNFLIETESVPFQSLVLSGYKPMYAPALNLYELGSAGVLKLIDYNLLPTYLLTESTAMDLIDSPASSYLYSSKYDVWEEELKETYDQVVNTLKQVQGEKFVSRTRLASGLYVNEYESGTRIVINYSSDAHNYLGHEIAPSSSEVIKP